MDKERIKKILEGKEDYEVKTEVEEPIDTRRFSGPALNIASQVNAVMDEWKVLFRDTKNAVKNRADEMKDLVMDELRELRSDMKQSIKDFRQQTKRVIRNDDLDFEEVANLRGAKNELQSDLLDGLTQVQNVRRNAIEDLDNKIKEDVKEIRSQMKDVLLTLDNIMSSAMDQIR